MYCPIMLEVVVRTVLSRSFLSSAFDSIINYFMTSQMKEGGEFVHDCYEKCGSSYLLRFSVTQFCTLSSLVLLQE